jgi:hypothetical protein
MAYLTLDPWREPENPRRVFVHINVLSLEDSACLPLARYAVEIVSTGGGKYELKENALAFNRFTIANRQAAANPGFWATVDLLLKDWETEPGFWREMPGVFSSGTHAFKGLRQTLKARGFEIYCN